MRAVILCVVMILTGCASNGAEVTTSVATVTQPSLSTTTQPLVVGCPVEEQFTEGGLIDEFDNTGSDSTKIGLVRWQAEEACETFEIEFETAEGAPATTPPSVRAEFIDEVGVLRISTSAVETVITDQLVETALVKRLYVVRALDGGMFIDLHLAAPTQARIDLTSSPARLKVELQPGIVPYSAQPVTAELIVLTFPSDEATIPTTLNVEGYARGIGSDVAAVAIVGQEGDDLVVEADATTADNTKTWGEFRVALELMPGPVALFVGDRDSDPGGFEGVSIDLVAG